MMAVEHKGIWEKTAPPEAGWYLTRWPNQGGDERPAYWTGWVWRQNGVELDSDPRVGGLEWFSLAIPTSEELGKMVGELETFRALLLDCPRCQTELGYQVATRDMEPAPKEGDSD